MKIDEPVYKINSLVELWGGKKEKRKEKKGKKEENEVLF